jgi:2'-5' RNA ligase
MENFLARNSGMGVFLPPEAGEIVNAWRRLYDPSHTFLAPHLTVAYPPFVPPEAWPEVRPTILACLANIAPFSIVLRETGLFLGNSHVLWLKPEDGGHLARIRQALEAALPEAVPPLPFVYQPHVSIGFFQDLTSLQEAQQKVELELKEPIEFEVNGLSYGFQQADNRWVIFDTVHFPGSPPSTVQGAAREPAYQT